METRKLSDHPEAAAQEENGKDSECEVIVGPAVGSAVGASRRDTTPGWLVPDQHAEHTHNWQVHDSAPIGTWPRKWLPNAPRYLKTLQ